STSRPPGAAPRPAPGERLSRPRHLPTRVVTGLDGDSVEPYVVSPVLRRGLTRMPNGPSVRSGILMAGRCFRPPSTRSGQVAAPRQQSVRSPSTPDDAEPRPAERVTTSSSTAPVALDGIDRRLLVLLAEDGR